MRVLVTGAAGFIGAHAVEAFIKETDWNVIGLVSFRHRGCPMRLEHLRNSSRLKIVFHDLQAPISPRTAYEIGNIDHIFNLAAESHVDRSIEAPGPFIRNNTDIIINMLDYAREIKPKTFFQISTDEVYGAAPPGLDFPEWSPIVPSNPYSASKACQEAIAIAYWRTYGIPLIITNTMNNIGERQDSEKFVPLIINKVLSGDKLYVHGRNGVSGSRFYLHARNHASALMFLVENTNPALYPQYDRPLRFNVVGEREVSNLEMAQNISRVIEKPLNYEIVDFHSSRPGHDLRYALDGTLLSNFGWKPPIPFEQSLEKTIRWTLANPQWLR